jgi:TolA-binding protein
MLTLLAQSAPPAGLADWLENFFWIVGSIGALIGCAVGVKTLFAKSDSMPQPLHVKAADEFVTHVEFSELKNDVEQIRCDVRDGFDKLGDERRTSVGNLHSKIDATNGKVDEMRGKLELINQSLAQINVHLLNLKT